MSNRRKRGRQPWRPWTAKEQPAHERIRRSVQPNGRTRIDAYGADAGAIAAIEAFRRNGATEVSFGWDAPGYEDADDVPVGVEVTWWFRVTYPGGRVQEGHARPTSNHALGILEAAAMILRRNGGTVTVHPPGGAN